MAASKETAGGGRRRSVEQGGRRKSAAMSLANPIVDMFGRRIKKVHYENTYRMEPKVLFPVQKATSVIKEVMEMRLNGQQYDPEKCSWLCKSLANDIKEHIKDLYVERYKYVTVVSIGQTTNMEILIASRCLLNPDFDTFATNTFNEHGLFAVATVYAFYRE